MGTTFKTNSHTHLKKGDHSLQNEFTKQKQEKKKEKNENAYI